MQKIPLVDLQAQYRTIAPQIDAAVAAVIKECAFIGGPHLERFEREFAAFCGTRYAIGVSNGTDALRLALSALGVSAGDEVITVPNTFIATTEAISMIGAKIRFVDIDPSTLGMNVRLLDRAITEKTRAIVPVHLYGQPADMEPILRFAEKHRLVVVEDAAQAHGATYRGRRVGGLGHAGCFSYYPGKNLGAYGDAGAVVTNDAEAAERISMLRNHGRAQKYEHAFEGFNCRLDGLQAAILSAKLPFLERWNDARRRIATSYREAFSKMPMVTLPGSLAETRSVFHLFVIRVPNRDSLMARLKEVGIECGIHYPLPLHLQPAYRTLNLTEGSFPVAEKAAREILSLPLFPEMSEEQVEFVIRSVSQAVFTKTP